MVVSVVLVHGIRTSATMWRSQLAYLEARGTPAFALDLPGHGTRRGEAFTIEDAFATIDEAVRSAAREGPVLLVGHSMGGLLSLAYTGAEEQPPVSGLVAASCTVVPRGTGLLLYRALAGALNTLPDRGRWLSQQILQATLPEETQDDFGAGGYALDVQDVALTSLASLDLVSALARIAQPLWFVNGQYDQLRTHEALFQGLAPHAELIVVPRSTHLVTAMRPRVFNAVLGLALATLEHGTEAS